MNCFFIITEISGLQQFLKIDSTATTEMIKNCERSINNSVHSEVQVRGSFLVFPVESGLDDAAAVLEAAEALLEILDGYSEEIHEFSMMLIYRRSTSVDEIMADMKQRFFGVCVEKGLLIENRVMRAANRSADDETYGAFQLVSIEERLSDYDDFEHLNKLIQPKEVNRLVRMIIPEIGNEAGNRNIILSGESGLVVRLNLSEAIKKASGKNKKPSAVYIDFLDNETDVVRPFARSIDKQLVPVVEDYLEGVELRTWLEGKSRLDSINSDYLEEYFFSIYSLYLKGVMTFFATAVQPGVVVVTGLRKEHGPSVRYAEKVLEYLSEDLKPAVFIIVNSENEKELDGIDCFSDFEKIACCADIQDPDVFEGLSFHHRRLLYVLKQTEGLFEYGMLEKFLLSLGYSSGEILSGLRLLEGEGFVFSGRYITLQNENKFEALFTGIAGRKDIARGLALFITDNLYNGEFSDYGRAAEKLSDFTDDETVANAVAGCLLKMLDFGRTAYVLNYLAGNDKLDPFISDAVELRCFLLENDKSSCLKMLKEVPDKPESPDTLSRAVLLFETGRYFHATNDHQRALDYVKKVLIFLQDGDFPRPEGIALTELGFLMLCKGKLLESSEYISLAIEKLAGCGDVYNLMKAYLFSAVQKYLWGSLDESLDDIERALAMVVKTGFVEWYFYIEFFKCRLFFELGRYYDAEKIMSGCLLRNELYRDNHRRKIFLAWIARACVYQGKIYRGINMLLSLEEDPEVLFFLSEAYYFNGNMEKALESIERAEAAESYFNLGFMPLEHISWKNGFAPVEGRVLRSDKDTGVLLQNIRALHAFLLGLTGNREYGTEILFSLTRDEKLSENDPYNRLYFYFYCQLLEHRQNTDMIDKLTLMSKALKYLQQTSSRINTPQIRQQFMSRNYWNSLLVKDAQKEKLI